LNRTTFYNSGNFLSSFGGLMPQRLAGGCWMVTLALVQGYAAPTSNRATSVATSHSGSRLLSLAEAKRVAFERNWDLLAAKANVDQAVAQSIVAHEFPNPTLSWSTQKINVDNRPATEGSANGLWDRNYDTIFAVNQLFELNKRSKRQASAVAGREAAEASFLDARRTLDLAIAKAYIAALLSQSNVRILHQTAESLQHEAKIAETRLNAGDLSKSDKAQIEIAASRSELDAETAQSNAVTARIAVEILLGEKSPTGAWMMTDDLGDIASSGNLQGPTAPRPDLVAAQASLRKADWDWRLQRAMQVPDPSVLVQYEHEPFDQPNTVGVGISLPLPIWNQNGGNIHAAAAVRDQASAQVGKIETQVASDISTAEVAYHEAAARWRKYEKEISPRSAEVLKSVSYAYQKGGAALLDLLEAERTDNDIRLATAQAMADSATAAATLANVRNVISPGSAGTTDHPKEHHASPHH
jgi:cobalt-zinc-cadmium efflux system outer membrane protein